MTWRSVGLVSGGVVLGYLLARVLREPSSAAKRVAAGVRDRVGSELGPGAQFLGDLIGWDWTPGALDFLGVQP